MTTADIRVSSSGSARAYGVADTPDRDLDRTISHLLSTVEENAGHLDVHTAAAQAAKDPALLAHHLRHAMDHVQKVSSHLVKLRTAVARRLPLVAQQLDDLDAAIPGNRSAEDEVPPGALDMSIAHDLASAQAGAAHINRHLSEAQNAQAAGNKVSVAFNISHSVHHIIQMAHDLSELDNDLSRRVPAVARENSRLQAAVSPAQPVPALARSAAADADYDVTPPDHGPQPA